VVVLEIIVLCAVIGCIPGAIAQSKGHSFLGWWIYGALLFIVALPHSLMLRGVSRVDPDTQRRIALEELGQSKTCPYCAETIKKAAVVCRHCGRDLPAPPAPTAIESSEGAPSSHAPLFATTIVEGKKPSQQPSRAMLVAGGGVVVLLVLIIVGTSNHGSSTSGAAGPSVEAVDPESYLNLCAAATVQARRLVRMRSLETSTVAPSVIWRGPPPRLQCGLLSGADVWGAVTIDASCKDPLDASCLRVVSVTSLRRGVRYLDKAAPTEEPAQVAPST
jgi:hypothetical protein